ncbi:MAG: class I SAM-dependent methyltransferase [bacterium]|nr:class I SAM-dependent methyltransferase [bacterium]
MSSNRDILLARFVRRLLALEPGSVLDVGCGRGQLLAACAAAGVRAEGIEPDADCVADCRAAGRTVRRGDAAPLPFADASFEWVTLRHVPHHLGEPRAALTEAWRVASQGLLIAEPWYDTSLPSQAFAVRIDRLLKRFDRARGMFHAEVLSPHALIELLPVPPADIEIEAFVKPTRYAPDEFELDVMASLGQLDVPEEDRAELRELRAAIKSGAVTDNGTVILRIGKDG